MHGYFVALQLYDTARLIANPYVYEEHRERAVRAKMDKLAETRIRARADGGVRVNQALAAKLVREGEREKKKAAKKAAARKAQSAEDDAMAVDENAAAEGGKSAEKTSLLDDPRFRELFENPEFQVDQDSREYALLNPSAAAAQQRQQTRPGGRSRTAVESEEEESDKFSSDGLGDDTGSASENGSASEDSDAAGGEC